MQTHIKKLTTEVLTEKTTFPRHVRLLSSRDFQAVFRDNTCRSSDRKWTLLVRHNDTGHARLGMAISKRIIKKAVVRNRMKRIVRESFRHHLQQLAGLDVVVMCRDGVIGSTNASLVASLESHWQRVAKRA